MNSYYSEVAKLALLLFWLAPDSVEAEHGFCLMKYVLIKTEQRSRLGQKTINALMSIASDKRTTETFPLERLIN